MEFETAAGREVPKLGLGTWQMDPAVARETVQTALDLGYRHVDTAQAYGNEAAVGAALRESDVDREEVFLTTKVHGMRRSFDAIVASTRDSLDRLGVEQVDLLLIHWPNPLADLETVVAALEEARERGWTRSIGVSNFGRDRLAKARSLADGEILTDQVLFHPWWPQRELLSYCQREDVLLTAYSPLANGGAIDDPVLEAAGKRHDKSGVQTALRWVTQHENVVTIPMSTSRDHLAENLDIFDFRLTQAEHDRITRPSYYKTGVTMARGMLGL
ncbi:MAG: aldo/keto reductase [Halococcoides sp.]